MIWRTRLALTSLVALALAGSALYGFNKGKQYGTSKIQSLWDAEVAQMALAQAAEVNAARVREQELQDQITALQRTHRNEIARINTRHAALVDSLRNRPETRADPPSVSGSTGTDAGCTGAGLARPDAEFLARYAADAQQLASGLSVCLSTLDQIRQSRISADR